jgi:hypothetical protein
LSHLEVTDLVWGIKDGTHIRSAWKAAVVAWNNLQCSGRRTPLDHDFDVAELWQRVRARQANGSRNYRAPIFYGPRPIPLPLASPRPAGKRIWPDRYNVRFDVPVQPPTKRDGDLDDLDGAEADLWPDDPDNSSASGSAAIGRLKEAAQKAKK